MSIFNRINEPIVLKEESNMTSQIQQLEFYSKIAPESVKKQIEEDIKMLSYGIRGEEAILFELKNSHIPMFILHDLFFEKDGLTTQIDFLVVTRKVNLIIECKNLYGNIEVDNQGNFSRVLKQGNRYFKEGMYSPITQNQRHLDMIKEIRLQDKHNFITKNIFLKYFNQNYKSIVVLANPKTMINMKFAKKEVKEKIIKADQLNNYIRNLLDTSDSEAMSDENMRGLAEFFLYENKVNTTDYTEKYKIIKDDNDVVLTNIPEKEVHSVIENTPLQNALKKYRLEQSRKEKVKPYFIYNNAELEEIIKVNPRTLEELKSIKGFGDIKCKKYGQDIILILEDFK